MSEIEGGRHDGHNAAPEHRATKRGQTVLYVLLGLLVALLAYNQYLIGDVAAKSAALSVGLASLSSAPVSAPSSSQGSVPSSGSGTSANLEGIAKKVMPVGVPAVYGQELGVSFDQAVKSLPILAKLDTSISLDDLGADGKGRYTKIGLQISCEYCCGADAIIFPNGQAACGCQHSYAMRGLAKYLLKNHAKEYTDEQVLEEMGKWKIIFFPRPVIQKAVEFEAAGKALNTVDLTSNKYRGFKASSSTGSAAGSSAGSLPSQVGGC